MRSKKRRQLKTPTSSSLRSNGLKFEVAAATRRTKAVEGIKEVLDDGRSEKGLATRDHALGEYGDSDLAETITNLKRQADALYLRGPGRQSSSPTVSRRGRSRAQGQQSTLRGSGIRSKRSPTAPTLAISKKPTKRFARALAKYDENRSKGADTAQGFVPTRRCRHGLQSRRRELGHATSPRRKSPRSKTQY